MTEIPVKHKTATGLAALPSWAWIVGVVAILGIIGLVLGLRGCGEKKTTANTNSTTSQVAVSALRVVRDSASYPLGTGGLAGTT